MLGTDKEIMLSKQLAEKEKQVTELKIALNAEKKFSEGILLSLNEMLTNNITGGELVGRVRKLMVKLQDNRNKAFDYVEGNKAPAYKEVPIANIAEDYLNGFNWKQLEEKYKLSATTMRSRLIGTGQYELLKEKKKKHMRLMKLRAAQKGEV